MAVWYTYIFWAVVTRGYILHEFGGFLSFFLRPVRATMASAGKDFQVQPASAKDAALLMQFAAVIVWLIRPCIMCLVLSRPSPSKWV